MRLFFENKHTDTTREMVVEGFVQLTYNELRIGPEGDWIGYYDTENDIWITTPDRKEWTDIVIEGGDR